MKLGIKHVKGLKDLNLHGKWTLFGRTRCESRARWPSVTVVHGMAHLETRIVPTYLSLVLGDTSATSTRHERDADTRASKSRGNTFRGKPRSR